jgi:hypothetical protein
MGNVVGYWRWPETPGVAVVNGLQKASAKFIHRGRISCFGSPATIEHRRPRNLQEQRLLQASDSAACDLES